MQICIIQILSIGIHIKYLTIFWNGLTSSERRVKLNQQKTENIYINIYFSRFLRDYSLNTVYKKYAEDIVQNKMSSCMNSF